MLSTELSRLLSAHQIYDAAVKRAATQRDSPMLFFIFQRVFQGKINLAARCISPDKGGRLPVWAAASGKVSLMRGSPFCCWGARPPFFPPVSIFYFHIIIERHKLGGIFHAQCLCVLFLIGPPKLHNRWMKCFCMVFYFV